jgi:hypothetical protein
MAPQLRRKMKWFFILTLHKASTEELSPPPHNSEYSMGKMIAIRTAS